MDRHVKNDARLVPRSSTTGTTCSTTGSTNLRTQTTHIDDLPDEVLVNIFSYVTKPSQLLTLRVVSSRWRNITSSKWFWNEVDLIFEIDYTLGFDDFANLFRCCLMIAPCLRSFDFGSRMTTDIEHILLKNCSSIRRLKIIVLGCEEQSYRILRKFKSVLEYLDLKYFVVNTMILMEIIPLMPKLRECILSEGCLDHRHPPVWELLQHTGTNDWPSLQKFTYFMEINSIQESLPNILESMGKFLLKLKELKLGTFPTHLVQFDLDKSLDLCRHMEVLTLSAECLNLQWDMRDKSWIELKLRSGQRPCGSYWVASRCLLSVREIFIMYDIFCPCFSSLLRGCINVEKVVAYLPREFFEKYEPLSALLELIEVLPNLKSLILKGLSGIVKPLMESKVLLEKSGHISLSFDPWDGSSYNL